MLTGGLQGDDMKTPLTNSLSLLLTNSCAMAGVPPGLCNAEQCVLVYNAVNAGLQHA
jgi:hypothetical protein